MTKYAVLDGESVVSNIILANSLQLAEQLTLSTCVIIPSGTFVDIGYTYAGGTFTDPNAVTPAEETPA